ncbi:uncharacterized protein MELLADRAFT_95848 [Melampsora larici-populina 98AG31]|uniref:Phosphotyrosine protein phosphatase I domain-containing protein n=1 Tax=Melampsora larici-populina (strain 98AG31 / pathotype 3-4-7) TaxID=747676 RepID=F4RDG6_MELLP|nr:uncharacterized protein MELLADRAFT_95848 [Melampsora larici-populina 98AG31]EGG09399.1 hypothetical protein MELLADRAFT_95848 [Melampsora larici-populina 98AG31]
MATNNPEKTYKILFVCLVHSMLTSLIESGNICRSPMAQAVFADLVEINGLSSHFPRIESAGTTNMHVGEAPDDRTVAICRKKGVPISSRAQHLKTQDFYDYDYILGMDEHNLRNIRFIMPSDAKAKVHLFGGFCNGEVIDDPYYGGKVIK